MGPMLHRMRHDLMAEGSVHILQIMRPGRFHSVTALKKGI